MSNEIDKQSNTKAIRVLDEQLAKRFIALDPSGYFLISLDLSTKELVVDHFSNDIDNQGRSINPDTGKPIECCGGNPRTPLQVYRGRSAKEVGIKLTEGKGSHPLSRLDHALYLGRELQRAEECLIKGTRYIQD
mgnify:CR=1 FL=1